MYKRYLDQKLLESIEESPVVLINGARQTGKSTLVQTLLKESHVYYTLDDYSILSAIQLDPYNFLASQKSPIILDEVQRAPEAFLALKRIVDESRVPGRFVLTGSANILMLPKLADSLAGRMEILTMWPLSSAELYDRPEQLISELLTGSFLNFISSAVDDSEYMPDILIGGYPEVVRRSTPAKRNSWFKGYIQTLLTRDVQDISGIERSAQLPILLNILASRVGGLLNASELSRSSQIPLTTLTRYLKIFEMLYLTVYLQPWHSNIGKRFVKSPKLYISDVGLISFLLGMNEEHIAQRPDLWGHMFENFIVMEFIKHQTWSDVPFQIYHYRTENNEEIDLILETDQGDLLAIEIKSSKTIDGRSLKAIKNLQAAMPHKIIKGFVIYTGDKVIPLSQNIWALPLSYFMQRRVNSHKGT
ncbi:MAG: ATP-binding protein [Alphaproteobacteria bacterium]|nr:ATP-binding protein [Alphaproteobacteria bacterium]